MAILFNGTAAAFSEKLKEMRSLEEHLASLTGTLFLDAWKLVERDADPAIVSFIFRWYQREKIPEVLKATGDATGNELDRRLLEYFRDNLGGARPWTAHVGLSDLEFESLPYESGRFSSKDILAEASQLAMTRKASPPLCREYGVDEFYAEEFRNVNPKQASLAAILVGNGLDPQLAYDSLAKSIPENEYPLFFRTAYLAAHDKNPGHGVNAFTRRFLKRYNTPVIPTSIRLPDPTVN